MRRGEAVGRRCGEWEGEGREEEGMGNGDELRRREVVAATRDSEETGDLDGGRKDGQRWGR